jgi:hypothetical protein
MFSSVIAIAGILNASCGVTATPVVRDPLSGFELIPEEWSWAVFFDAETGGCEAVPERFRNPRFIQDSIV